MYSSIVNCTNADDNPPKLVNLIAIIEKCWKGKQNKF